MKLKASIQKMVILVCIIMTTDSLTITGVLSKSTNLLITGTCALYASYILITMPKDSTVIIKDKDEEE